MLRRAVALAVTTALAVTLGLVAASDAAVAGTATVTPKTITTATAGTIYRGGLYVQADGDAATAAKKLSGSRKTAAVYISHRSAAVWLGDWVTGKALTTYVKRILAAAEKKKTTPVFVTYALPDRDCGGHSAGGLTPAQYRSWSTTLSKALSGHHAVVLIEPDSLSTGCTTQNETVWKPLIAAQVKALHDASVPAYLDGGLSGAYLNTTTMVSRLKGSGIAYARGFFTNVSNYRTTADEQRWANTLSKALGGKHYVIDVSRNGTGYHGEWCNDFKAGLGASPHVVARGAFDAVLWVKVPGASDGTCHGGPASGQWFAGFADALYQHR